MEFFRPTTWAEALAIKAEHGASAIPIAGGTDVMVEINFDRLRPPALLDLTGIPQLREWGPDDGHLRGGRGFVYAHRRRARQAPTGTGHGLAHHRLPADPQPRHGGRQSRFGLPALGMPIPRCSPFRSSWRSPRTTEVCVACHMPNSSPVPSAARWPRRAGHPRRGPHDDVRGSAAYRHHALARNPCHWTGHEKILDAVRLALMEEIQVAEGRIRNPSFTGYRIPTILDLPPLRVDVLELADPHAPYGLRGVGEPPTISSTPVIVAGIRAATARSPTRVPVRPQDIIGV
jgi:FAD binding domain in molybdopterin dehydrogenase